LSSVSKINFLGHSIASFRSIMGSHEFVPISVAMVDADNSKECEP